MKSNRLVYAAVLSLVLQGVGAAFAIAHRLPYEFGGLGDPNNVATDFIGGGGTALSAPLIPLLIFAGLIRLSLRRDRWGTLAVLAMVPVSALFTVAGSQEPILWRTLQSGIFGLFEIVIVALGVAGLVLAPIMLVLAVMELIERIKTGRGAKSQLAQQNQL
jgi:hypothetical protein